MRKTFKGVYRKATVTTAKGIVPEGTYAVDFWYDGYPDYQALRGCNGVACKLFPTEKQAIRCAKYYVSKDNNVMEVAR